MKQSTKLYIWLLAVNLFISAFTFGGGYIVVPMVRRFFVAKKHCFTEEDLVNIHKLYCRCHSPVSYPHGCFGIL